MFRKELAKLLTLQLSLLTSCNIFMKTFDFISHKFKYFNHLSI